jgi:hypothetical protein
MFSTSMGLMESLSVISFLKVMPDEDEATGSKRVLLFLHEMSKVQDKTTTEVKVSFRENFTSNKLNE